MVPTHPRSLFLHTNPAFVGAALAHTDLAFVSVFGAHTDSTDSTRIFARIQKKMIREIRGIRGFQSATN